MEPTPPPLRKLKEPPKSISIKDALNPATRQTPPEQPWATPNGNIPSGANDAPDAELYDEELGSSMPLTQEELTMAWLGYIDRELQQKPAYASLLKSYTPTLTGDLKILITFETQLQCDLFMEIKNDLVQYLKKRFPTNTINLEENFKGVANGKNKLYTVDDKFKHMSHKNPILLKLRQQLNLDFT